MTGIELLLKSLVSAKAKIIDSKNPSNIGFEGEIIDETKNMITIGKKRFIKDQNVFNIKVEEKTFRIDGKELVGRPEERIKKWLRKKPSELK